MELIDKDAVTAEIEKLIGEIYAGRPFDSLSSEQQTALWYVKSIMSSVNNLKVKEVEEVDLVKEISNWWDKHYDHNGKYKFGKYSGHYIENSTIITLAKHFFELGIAASNKTKKGE